MAIPTASTCDSEDTEPITSSGEGMARAATGSAEKSVVNTMICAERRWDPAGAGVKVVFFTAFPVEPVRAGILNYGEFA